MQALPTKATKTKAVCLLLLLLLPSLSVLLRDFNLPLLKRIKSLCDASTVAVFV